MINTWSAFNFGHLITTENRNFPFNEGAGEVNAVLSVGSYTLGEFVIELQTALNAASVTRTFTVTLARSTRKITIAADGVFSILLSTGTTVGSSVFNLAGFTTTSDLTAASTYTGDSPSGEYYRPQFKLQSFVDKEDFQERADAAVNEAPSGDIEIINFGTNQFYEMDIKFITNLVMDGTVIRYNPTGLQDAREFLRDITKRHRFEFVPDVDTPDTFDKVILDQIPGNSTATGYKLKELFDRNLPNIYETGVIRLKVLE